MVFFVFPLFSVWDVLADGLAVIHGIASLLLKSLAYKCMLQNYLSKKWKQCEEGEIGLGAWFAWKKNYKENTLNVGAVHVLGLKKIKNIGPAGHFVPVLCVESRFYTTS